MILNLLHAVHRVETGETQEESRGENVLENTLKK